MLGARHRPIRRRFATAELARRGSRVSLIEAGPQVGGTVADALIHTLGGLYDSAGEFLNDGLAKEMAQRLIDADTSVFRRRMGRVWVLNVCPNLYRRVARGCQSPHRLRPRG